MEKIAQVGTLPQTERYPLAFRLFPIRLIAFSLVMGFTSLIICTKGLSQNAEPPPSPFASFADIFPGQPADSIEARGFFCMVSPYGALADSLDEHCILKLETGSMADIRVIVVERTIHQTQFTLREDRLRLGDLMIFLGAPEVRQTGHTIQFVWHGSGIFASADSDTRLFSPLIPLSMVSFTNACIPGVESPLGCPSGV